MNEFGHLPDAMAIYQEHLDLLSTALVSGNLTAFGKGIAIPHRMITETGERAFSTPDEMAQAFYAMHRTLKAQGVTEFLRIAASATYMNETRICGLHETHIIRSGKRLVPPYPNRVRLEFIDGAWIETVSANAIQCDPKKMLMPKVSADPKLPTISNSDPERTPQ